jgi:hypothetical protein
MTKQSLMTSLFAIATWIISPLATAIEEPQYEVITAWEEHSIELRSYAPRLLAVTTVTRKSQ